MEAVKAFNNELASLYESKPPVSRAKMACITKSAIKAVKFYKHVVQSVEKFISKCRAEYKVPGLYVIDSIVRQSRHHFGIEKDVFAQRFSKNIVATFQQLCSCPLEEKNKVVRVLHLWQKNNMFPNDVIQQLLKMVEQDESTTSATEESSFGENQISQHLDNSNGVDGATLLPMLNEQSDSYPADEVKLNTSLGSLFASKDDRMSCRSQSSIGSDSAAGLNVETNVISAVMQLLQNQQPLTQLLQQQLMQQLPQQLLQPGSLSLPQQLLQHIPPVSELQQQQQQQQQQQHPLAGHLSFTAGPLSSVVMPPSTTLSASSPLMSVQHRRLEQESLPLPESLGNAGLLYDRRSEENSQGSEPRFNKNLLEFDYDESDDEGRQNQSQDEEVAQSRNVLEEQRQHSYPHQQFQQTDSAAYCMTHKMPNASDHFQHEQQQQQFEEHPTHPPRPLLSGQALPPPGEPMERHEYFHGSQAMKWPDENSDYDQPYRGAGFSARQLSGWKESNDSGYENMEQRVDQRYQQDYEDNQSRDRGHYRSYDDRKRRRSRDRSPRRRGHSRNDHESARGSRSRDRRRRSRSRDKSRRSRSRSQDRMREREKRERERERRNRGLPPIHDNHISVCSTTLWIGHLSKHTKEGELKEELAKYGEITSFNLIPPRGCSYVSFRSRKEASRTLERLKGSKLLGNVVKVAWAMGVGIKESKFKDTWNVDQGVSYIEWNRIPEDLDSLTTGGYLDEDTLPEAVKVARREKTKEKENPNSVNGEAESEVDGLLPSGPNGLSQTMTEASAPAVPPPLPSLPPGMVPSLLPPPPGFVPPPMMMHGAVPPMMRLPPAMMTGMMPGGMTGPGAPLPPPPRPSMPPSTSSSEPGVDQIRSSDAIASGMATDNLPPVPPPGMGFGWHPNMRPGMMPFRAPMPPFIPPGPFRRMPFPPPPPSSQFQGPREPKDGKEGQEDGAMEPMEKEEEGNEEHSEQEPSLPPPPGAPPGAPPRLPWPNNTGLCGPMGGPRPDFMGGRLRAPFGPHGGFPPALPHGRLTRSDEEGMGEGEPEDRMDEETDVGDSGFPGPNDSAFPAHNFENASHERRNSWFDFRGGPPEPRGMRFPGPPRFPFEERGAGIGRPPFRSRGPSLMEEPPMAFRGRPPFPLRRPGMPDFRSFPMEPGFNRPPFGGRGPRPLFPRGFRFPREAENYDETFEEGGPGEIEEAWNEGQEGEEEEEERWNRGTVDNADERRERRGHERRGQWENSEMDWRGGGNRREGSRERNWWKGRGQRDNMEEGDNDRRRGQQRRDREMGRREDHDRGIRQQHGEETDDFGGRSKSAWGGFFDAATGEATGLQEREGNTPATEKKPRKTRWSSAVEPVEHSAAEETGQAAGGSDTSMGLLPLEQDTPFAAESDEVDPGNSVLSVASQ